MNEVEFLEAQLAAERRHVHEVASWCAMLTARGRSESISLDRIYSYCRYLMFYIGKEEARAAAHLELAPAPAPARGLESGPAPGPALRAASERLRGALVSAREEAARVSAVFAGLQAGSPPVSHLDELAQFAERVADLTESRVALATLAAPRYTLDERRRAAHLDADSILEERRLHAEAARHGTSVVR